MIIIPDYQRIKLLEIIEENKGKPDTEIKEIAINNGFKKWDFYKIFGRLDKEKLITREIKDERKVYSFLSKRGKEILGFFKNNQQMGLFKKDKEKKKRWYICPNCRKRVKEKEEHLEGKCRGKNYYSCKQKNINTR